jgi:dCTP deaminase
MYGEPPKELENCPVEEEYGEQHWIIPSQTFALGTSREAINVPNDLVADVEGRSTTGRTGLIIHATAGFIDPGFYGEITFEMFNLRDCPIKIPLDTRIGQMIFYEMASRPERPYGEQRGSKYQNQFGPTPAKSDI